MEALFGLIETMLICGTLFGVAFLVVLSLPQSKARDVLKYGMGRWRLVPMSSARWTSCRKR